MRRTSASSDIILKVAAAVEGALGRRRRQVCGGLKVFSLMSGFCTEQFAVEAVAVVVMVVVVVVVVV
eukprot:7918208-Heterocapsa_arctica.AAC.1